MPAAFKLRFMPRSYFLFFIAIICYQTVAAQQQVPISREQFFLDGGVINVELTTDIRKLRLSKKSDTWQPARIVMNFADTLKIDETIRVQTRGVYRKANCDIAALMLDFKTKTSPLLSDLKKLKFVGGCYSNLLSEDYLLKEYLVYKLYNILSEMSFRVRLLRVTYNDSLQKIKSYTQYAFLIEDIKDLADRNECREVKKKTYRTEGTDRIQVTFMSIFQYMIGNTDWAIPNYHNIKLLVPLSDTFAKPYPVAYDFDYAGIVDASYATPAKDLEITNVRERSYRGYKRTMEELRPIVSVFNEKKDSVLQYVNDFSLLKPGLRKNISNYLEQFYDILEKESSVSTVFIYNALQP